MFWLYHTLGIAGLSIFRRSHLEAESSWIKANLDVLQQVYEHVRLFAYGTNIEFALPCIATKGKRRNKNNNNEHEKNIIEVAPAGSQPDSTQNEKPEQDLSAPAVCPDNNLKKRPLEGLAGPVVKQRRVAYVSTDRCLTDAQLFAAMGIVDKAAEVIRAGKSSFTVFSDDPLGFEARPIHIRLGPRAFTSIACNVSTDSLYMLTEVRR